MWGIHCCYFTVDKNIIYSFLYSQVDSIFMHPPCFALASGHHFFFNSRLFSFPLDTNYQCMIFKFFFKILPYTDIGKKMIDHYTLTNQCLWTPRISAVSEAHQRIRLGWQIMAVSQIQRATWSCMAHKLRMFFVFRLLKKSKEECSFLTRKSYIKIKF